METVVGMAPANVRRALRAALLLFGIQPPGLSRLEPARAIRRLEGWERSRLALRREAFHLLKALVCVCFSRDERVVSAIGASQTCKRTGDRSAPGFEPQPAPLAAEQLVAPAATEDCDVVVVGSGAGGAACARVLAEQGLDVIVCEQGGYHDASSYSRDPVAAVGSLYRQAGLTACEGLPAIPVPVGRCVGGTTVINSGTCLRAPEDVLERWRSEFGIWWATGLGDQFDLLEEALGVTVLNSETAGQNAALCRAGAQALGLSNSALRRNAPGVTECGSCPTGCPLDAKQAMHVCELPRAVAAGARVRANAGVREVIVENARAVGVACDGYEVRARAVVVAAGAFGTPELLLAQGFRPRSKALGRHLRIHPACWVGALFEQEVRGWEGVMQSWLVDEFHDQGLFLEATATPLAFGAHFLPGVGAQLKRRIADYGRLAVIGVHLSERSQGRVSVRGGRMRARYQLSGADAATLAFGIARAAEIHAAAGASEIYPQLAGLDVLEPDELARIDPGRIGPRNLRLEAFHPMGTARMAADPTAGVVDPNGEAHDLPGLYLADASILPTSPRVNPMLTIMACARQIAAGLATRLG